MKRIAIAIFVVLCFVNNSFASTIINEYNYHNYSGEKMDFNNPQSKIPNAYVIFENNNWFFYDFNNKIKAIVPDDEIVNNMLENGCPVIITLELFDTFECLDDVKYWLELGFNSGFDERSNRYFFYDFSVNKYQYVEN